MCLFRRNEARRVRQRLLYLPTNTLSPHCPPSDYGCPRGFSGRELNFLCRYQQRCRWWKHMGRTIVNIRFHNIYNTLQYNGHIAQACGAHLYPSRLHREWRGSLTEITLISFIVELTMNSPSTRFGWAAEHTKRQVYYSERY